MWRRMTSHGISDASEACAMQGCPVGSMVGSGASPCSPFCISPMNDQLRQAEGHA